MSLSVDPYSSTARLILEVRFAGIDPSTVDAVVSEPEVRDLLEQAGATPAVVPAAFGGMS